VAIGGVTFDVYSALFDTLAGLARVLAPLLRRRGAAGDAQALARTWRAKHMEYLLLATVLGEGSATNRRAIERSAAYALRGVIDSPLTTVELVQLTAAWEHLPPWPETAGVLQTVRAWPQTASSPPARAPLILGALSNGDAGMLSALLAGLPLRFDHVISTEGGPFKPHRTVYEKALRAMGLPAEGLLHVAGSPTDAMGATAAGIRTLWVNRAGDAVIEPTLRPAHESHDLHSVLDILTELG
jgi:2-haloacid dehalogenase